MKTIITDVDECVLSWHKGFQSFIKSKGLSPSSDISTCLDIESWLDIPYDETRRLMIEFNHSDAFGDLKPDYNSMEVIPRLHDDGYRFIALTSCGIDERTVRLRQDNIKKYFPNIFEEVICIDLGESKHSYLEDLPHESYWVEDKFKNAAMGLDFGNTCFLMNHTHNRNFESEKIIRVDDWYGISRYIYNDQ